MHLRSLVCHSIHYTNMHTTITLRYSNDAKCSVFTVSFDTAGFSNLGGWTNLMTLIISSKFTALNSVSLNNDVERW
jgi:hypothetical protein